jgi:YD repeat-containing protein
VDLQTPRYVTRFGYDAKNNLTSVTDARGFVTTHSYDPLTNLRLSTRAQIDTLPTYATTKWEYNDLANPGLPTAAIAPRGNSGPTPDPLYATTFTYDATGNLLEKVDPDGNRTTFGYDLG